MTAAYLRRSLVVIFLVFAVGVIEVTGQTTDHGPISSPVDRGPDSRGPKKGVLYISGGSNKSAEGVKHNQNLRFPKFVGLIRKARSTEVPEIVVITTAGGSDKKGEHPQTLMLEKLVGEAHVTELFTLSREEANSPAFIEPITRADGVWMTGGQQGQLADTFLGTGTEDALKEVLARGGVIGGTSAGAQFQSSFMTRGMEKTGRSGPILGDGRHQRGLGLITHTAFDVHVAARGREKDLFELFATEPGQLRNKSCDPMQLLGIGIDELTAAIVRQDQLEIVGEGHVYIFNPREWNNATSPFFRTLSPGDRYDIKARTIIQRER